MQLISHAICNKATLYQPGLAPPQSFSCSYSTVVAVGHKVDFHNYYFRVMITAVNKTTTELPLVFFNNCFDNEYSTREWKVKYKYVGYLQLWSWLLICVYQEWKVNEWKVKYKGYLQLWSWILICVYQDIPIKHMWQTGWGCTTFRNRMSPLLTCTLFVPCNQS